MNEKPNAKDLRNVAVHKRVKFKFVGRRDYAKKETARDESEVFT